MIAPYLYHFLHPPKSFLSLGQFPRPVPQARPIRQHLPIPYLDALALSIYPECLWLPCPSCLPGHLPNLSYYLLFFLIPTWFALNSKLYLRKLFSRGQGCSWWSAYLAFTNPKALSILQRFINRV